VKFYQSYFVQADFDYVNESFKRGVDVLIKLSDGERKQFAHTVATRGTPPYQFSLLQISTSIIMVDV